MSSCIVYSFGQSEMKGTDSSKETDFDCLLVRFSFYSVRDGIGDFRNSEGSCLEESKLVFGWPFLGGSLGEIQSISMLED